MYSSPFAVSGSGPINPFDEIFSISLGLDAIHQQLFTACCFHVGSGHRIQPLTVSHEFKHL